jgi:DNA-binding MarR family transcriptional regulator
LTDWHEIVNADALNDLMLANIGDAEMTVGELTSRGRYLGSNVSYNVKKLVENGYLHQERSAHDRRSFLVRPTEKGRKLRDQLISMPQRHFDLLTQAMIPDESLRATTGTLRRLEQFWTRVGDLVQRPGQFAA